MRLLIHDKFMNIWFQTYLSPQVISKLHSILRPFLLRRMKEEVEQLLPRKKEIILYANMTDHQKMFQDHLINKTLENYMENHADNGE